LDGNNLAQCENEMPLEVPILAVAHEFSSLEESCLVITSFGDRCRDAYHSDSRNPGNKNPSSGRTITIYRTHKKNISASETACVSF
jgi:hypothetical protein